MSHSAARPRAAPALQACPPHPGAGFTLAIAEDNVRCLCATLSPLPGHAPLCEALRRATGLEFAPRVSRGGWYRPGRIVDAAGHTLADDALAWLEHAWRDSGEDLAAFCARHAATGPTVTLLQGTSHYLVAPYGDGPSEYLQLEIEAVQEVASHAVGRGRLAEESAEGLLARPADAPPPRPLGLPRYHLRRLVDVADFVARIPSAVDKPASVRRFLHDWQHSSAGRQHHFSDHWVLALAEHLDRYRQPQYSALPIAVQTPGWPGGAAGRGVALAQQLHDFDRSAGHGFAWYFHLVSGHRVPRWIAPAVFADLRDGMAYLAERDAALLRDWMLAPYAL